MKGQEHVRKEEAALRNIKRLYTDMISAAFADREHREKTKMELFRLQREDGSWAVTDDKKAPSDFRVDYIYIPTYYATAALMAYMNAEGPLDENEIALFDKGLKVSLGRKLSGSGYSATRYRIDALGVYKKAGLYEWMNRYGSLFPEFSGMISNVIDGFRRGLMTGRTYSDWNENFEEDFVREVKDYEEGMIPWVWYAAYGSNISKKRFMKYIERCRDQSAPAEDHRFEFPYSIIFAGKSSIWRNKGKAFLDDRIRGRAFGRIYKITRSQFVEIQQMEGPDYDKRLDLGWIEGIPVYTFTNTNLGLEANSPSPEYLQVILDGLKETYPEKSELALRVYLFSRNVMSPDDMKVLCFIRESEHGVSLQEIADHPGCPCLTKARTSIKKLVSWKLLRQDGRSVRNGDRIQDREAVFYTNKENRDLIDIILMLRKGASAIDSSIPMC